jgi:hypothetical protein
MIISHWEEPFIISSFETQMEAPFIAEMNNVIQPLING